MNLELVDPFELHSELPEVFEAKIEDGDVAVCAFNRRGNLLAGGCTDGKVIVWDFDTHGVSRTFEGHTASVTSVAWTRLGRRLFSARRTAAAGVRGAHRQPLAQVDVGVPVHLAVLHPRNRDLCLACAQAQGARAPSICNTCATPRSGRRCCRRGGRRGEQREREAWRRRRVLRPDGERVLMATARGVVHGPPSPGATCSRRCRCVGNKSGANPLPHPHHPHLTLTLTLTRCRVAQSSRSAHATAATSSCCRPTGWCALPAQPRARGHEPAAARSRTPARSPSPSLSPSPSPSRSALTLTLTLALTLTLTLPHLTSLTLTSP